MPKEHEKIKYLPGEKSLKVPFIVYAGLECLLKKVQPSQNNPENSHIGKNVKHKRSGYAWGLICKMIQKTDAIFIGEEKLLKTFVKIGTEIINFEEKEMIPLTNKEIKSYEKQKVCHICDEKFCID